MTLRIVTLLAVIGTGYLVVAVAERRTRPATVTLPQGLTVISGPNCQLCVSAIAALRARGSIVNVVDISEAPDSLGKIRGIPHAVIVDANDRVAMRRSGRSVLTDADHIAQRTAQASLRVGGR
jgi:hypothetical protein